MWLVISGAFRDRRSAGGMDMREAKSVQRMPEAKLLGASMDLAEPHGRAGRQHGRCDQLMSAGLLSIPRSGGPFQEFLL